jgi:[acyl-carrier-protein] S-malonyltransferase
MLSALAAAEPLVQQTFAEASEALGYDLWQLCQQGPEDQLGQTAKTQPAMLTGGVAVWRVWRSRGGPIPTMMAGHSLGEYTALVCAGTLDFSAAVKLVRFRGEAMQAAVPAGTGAMAAILGLEDADVEAACAEAAQGGVVTAANYNSPSQVVIAGQSAAVERAIEAAKKRGAKRALKLPVSVPSHTSLMQPAADNLARELERLQVQPTQGVEIFTVNLTKHTTAESTRRALVEQLIKPVRWADTVRAMVTAGARTFIECGPGQVLTGLNRRIERDKSIAMFAIEDPAALDSALKAVSA